MNYEVVKSEMVVISDWPGVKPAYAIRLPGDIYFWIGEQSIPNFEGPSMTDEEATNVPWARQGKWMALAINSLPHPNGTMACELTGTDILLVTDRCLNDRTTFIRPIAS
jgi:hypothetical protein